MAEPKQGHQGTELCTKYIIGTTQQLLCKMSLNPNTKFSHQKIPVACQSEKLFHWTMRDGSRSKILKTTDKHLTWIIQTVTCCRRPWGRDKKAAPLSQVSQDPYAILPSSGPLCSFYSSQELNKRPQFPVPFTMTNIEYLGPKKI